MLVFPKQASGSLVIFNGRTIGSEQIGQVFTGVQYLQPRPSMAGNGYDPLASGGSNTAASAQKEKDIIMQRASAFRKANGLSADTKLPVDMLYASGSGLDPDISPAAAKLQAGRIASARGIEKKQVLDLIDKHMQEPLIGIIGMPTVNVLAFNIALDRLD